MLLSTGESSLADRTRNAERPGISSAMPATDVIERYRQGGGPDGAQKAPERTRQHATLLPPAGSECPVRRTVLWI